MRRIVSVFAAMAVVAAMVAVMAMPAFAHHGTDNSINAGKRSQIAVNNSSQSLNQNITQNANPTATIGVNQTPPVHNLPCTVGSVCPVGTVPVQNTTVTSSGSIGQGANAVVTKQKQNNQNFQARNSFNRYHR